MIARMTFISHQPGCPMDLRPRFFAVLILVLVCGPTAWLGAASDWQPVEWRGEKAWAANCAGWTAIVSEERARLVSLTPPDGGDNLLFSELKNEISWGGHRFWLGPQTGWAAVWPPPPDWETSPAARIEQEGAVLRVVHSRTDASYPGLERTYAWHGGVLHCTATWSGERFHGVHILQIPPDAVVRVKRKITRTLPLGYVLLPIYLRDGLLTDRELSPAVGQVEGDTITLRGTGVGEKIGVFSQSIVAEIGAYQLTMRRGKMTGMSEATPDLGLLTQVFLGSNESMFTEIEQLTPFGGGGVAVSEILIEPEILKSKRPPQDPMDR